MFEFFYTIKAGFKILFDTLLFFFYSFCTIFFTIILIKLSDGTDYLLIFENKDIVVSFLATIPTFLIGIFYSSEEENGIFNKFLFFLILISIVLFVFMIRTTIVTDMNSVINITYTLLIISLLFTFLSKFNVNEFLDDIKTQIKAEKSKDKKEKTFSNGKKVTF